MARNLSDIYTFAKQTRNEYLQLNEFENTSKMSILDAFTWVTSTCIWAFENLLDVFQVDVANDIQQRINGTSSYYANALLKFQYKDKLIMNEEGTQFQYANIDESKRIITKVAYEEVSVDGYHDKRLILKVATGEPGKYNRLDENQILEARKYLRDISFAGTNFSLVSCPGDVLIPRLTVYYDGVISKDDVYKNIENSLNDFISNSEFNDVVYAQHIIDAIQRAEHVVDVYYGPDLGAREGIFIAQYNNDNELIPQSYNNDGSVASYEKRIGRYIIPNSGYLKQSDGVGAEKTLSTWRQSITLVVEEKSDEV